MINKRSSKEEMEQQLEILRSVQRVETPDYLYERIMKRINDRKMSVIPMRWAIAAAAAILIFFAADAYLIYQHQVSQENSEIASLIPTQSNHLYNE